ncbi:hypothetical protein FCV25MIE_02716 [Fagus crenata]
MPPKPFFGPEEMSIEDTSNNSVEIPTSSSSNTVTIDINVELGPSFAVLDLDEKVGLAQFGLAVKNGSFLWAVGHLNIMADVATNKVVSDAFQLNFMIQELLSYFSSL